MAYIMKGGENMNGGIIKVKKNGDIAMHWTLVETPLWI